MKKEVVQQETYCDVCGEYTDNCWFMTANRWNGGVLDEYSNPIDLCDNCIHYYNSIIKERLKGVVSERYDGEPSQKDKEELIKKLKEKAYHD